MRRLSLIGLSLFSLCLAIQPALAWSEEGHRAVAAIAYELLSPAQRAQADGLTHAGVGRDFIHSSTYPDDVIRQQDAQRRFSHWHYTDWPLRAAEPDMAACAGTCLLAALPAQIRVLRSAATPAERGLALSWVVHLLGDMHQPLHAADRDGDRGGNDYKISYRVIQNACEQVPDLHKVWDDWLPCQLPGIRDPAKFASNALRRHQVASWRDQRYVRLPIDETNFRDWVVISHNLAAAVAYADLPPGPRGKIRPAYVRRALPVVDEQLITGGVRLAAIVAIVLGE